MLMVHQLRRFLKLSFKYHHFLIFRSNNEDTDQPFLSHRFFDPSCQHWPLENFNEGNLAAVVAETEWEADIVGTDAFEED